MSCGAVSTDQVFTFAISANMFAPLLVAGPILDLFGPRACSCVSTALVGLGFLLFGISSRLPGCPSSYFLPSILIIGIGCPGCQCSLFHIANLFRARGLALNCITSSIGVSFVIFELLVSWTHNGVGLQTAFLVYSALPLTLVIVGFLTMPDLPYSHTDMFSTDAGPNASELPSVRSTHAFSIGAARPMVFIRRKRVRHRSLRIGDSFAGDSGASVNRTMSMPLLSARDEKPKNQFAQSALDEKLKSQSIQIVNQICCQAFFELVVYFAMTSLFSNLFLGNMKEMAEAAILVSSHDASAPTVADSYVSMFFKLVPLSSLINPALGYTIDRCGLVFMLSTNVLLGSAYAFLLWLGLFAPGAATYSIFSASYFAYTYSFLAFEFGFEYYGLLAGIVQSIGSVVILFLLPLAQRVATVYGWSTLQMTQVVAFPIFGVFALCSRLLRFILSRRSSLFQQQQQQQREALLLSEGVDGSRHGASLKNARINRSYSTGDIHLAESDQPCRRRPNLFPQADDILLIDGAHSHHSRAAYRLEESPAVHDTSGRSHSLNNFS